MKQSYVQQVVDVLRQNDVEACYDKKQDLVYGLIKSPFGDIYGLYKQESDHISSYTLFQPEVKPSVMEKVVSYLDGFNKEALSGYFYIDPILSRVVYCVDYKLAHGTDTLVFEQFCLYGYSLMKDLRQLLYWLITGSLMKTTETDLSVYMS